MTGGPTVASHGEPGGILRRLGFQALLWAGPLGIGLAASLLAVAAPWFRHGPGVPTAGDPRAWGALWGALSLVALGCALGAAASVAWLGIAWRRGRRPRALEWVRTGVNLLLGLGLVLFYWSP